jgi:hypothetical protein
MGPGRTPVGVDRLSVSFPLAGYRDEVFTDRRTVQGPGRTVEAESLSTSLRSARYPGAGVFVGVRYQPGSGFFGKVECNPARLNDPEGCSLLSLDRVGLAVGLMWAAAEGIGVVSAVPVEDWRVKRLDVARDYVGVTVPGFYVRGLMNVRRPYARVVSLYADPARGAAETLWAGSKAGGCRLYDQHQAYAQRGAQAGAMRFEVEARSSWLSKVGIETVADLTSGNMESLAAQRWEWSGMGTQITGMANVVERVQGLVHSGELSQAKALHLLGALVAESFGVGAPKSRSTHADYRRWYARLGVRPTVELFAGADVQVTGRLDWESGREVLAA